MPSHGFLSEDRFARLCQTRRAVCFKILNDVPALPGLEVWHEVQRAFANVDGTLLSGI